jgi:type II secretory pathway pseudopilin PulG
MSPDQSNRRSSKSLRKSGGRFSLIEIAVMAVIIVLFVAAVFPVRAMVRFQTEKSLAYERARGIEFALRAYEEEYKKLPINPVSIKDDFYETVSDDALMAIVRGGENPQNPLRTVFYLGRSDPAGQLEIRDPWGNLFKVRMDSDSDKYVTLPKECAGDVKKSDEGRIKYKVIVWSMGRPEDGGFGEPNTWIKSWYRP